jgi:hypothetical protein
MLTRFQREFEKNDFTATTAHTPPSHNPTQPQNHRPGFSTTEGDRKRCRENRERSNEDGASVSRKSSAGFGNRITDLPERSRSIVEARHVTTEGREGLTEPRERRLGSGESLPEVREAMTEAREAFAESGQPLAEGHEAKIFTPH